MKRTDMIVTTQNTSALGNSLHKCISFQDIEKINLTEEHIWFSGNRMYYLRAGERIHILCVKEVFQNIFFIFYFRCLALLIIIPNVLKE